MLELRHASLKIRGKTLLDRVSLAIEPKKFTAIIGPNGAGKSTAMRLLSGEVKPSSGEARLDTVPLTGWHPAALAQRRAVMTQHDGLTFPLSVAEVLKLGRFPFGQRGLSPADEQCIKSAAHHLELQEMIHLPYPPLSGGEKARVRLASALAQLSIAATENPAPRYLLLDEPLASLDLRHQHSTLRLIRKLRQENIATVMVIHDLNLALRYADRVAVIGDGRLLAYDDTETVMEPESLTRWFDTQIRYLRTVNEEEPLLVSS